MRVMRIIFFALIVFLSLPEMMIGIPSLYYALRAHGDVWSVHHDYLGDALFMLIPG